MHAIKKIPHSSEYDPAAYTDEFRISFEYSVFRLCIHIFTAITVHKHNYCTLLKDNGEFASVTVRRTKAWPL